MRRRLSQSPIFSQDRTSRALPRMIPDRTFNNINKMLCMSLPLREFFSRITAHRIFLDQFPLQEFFWELSPHLRLFLMVCPYLCGCLLYNNNTPTAKPTKLLARS